MPAPPLVLVTVEQPPYPVVTEILARPSSFLATESRRDQLSHGISRSAEFGRTTLIAPPPSVVANGVFPSTPILDAFNRANEGPPPSANWGAPLDDPSRLQVSQQRCTATGAGTYGSAYWSAAQFGPDAEVYCTIFTTGNFLLYARISNPGPGALNGYAADFLGGSTQIRLWKITAGVYALVSAAVSLPVPLAAGQVLGFKVVGNTLIAYQNGVVVLTGTDSTYAAAGYIGIDLGIGEVFDDFGGGTVPSVPQRYSWIGPYPPMVVNSAAATQQQQTIQTSYRVTVQNRNDWRRRFPLQGHTGWLERESSGVGSGTLGAVQRLLGPRPPAVIDPLPTQQQQTISVRTVALPASRRHPDRATRWELGPPQALRTFIGPTIHVVRSRPRPTTTALAPPTVLQTFVTFPPKLIRARPRPTTTTLAPPATLEPESVAIAERTIRVVLVRARPRPTTTFLAPPTVLQVFGGPRTPFVRARPRPTRSDLPVVIISARGAFYGPAVRLANRQRFTASRRPTFFLTQPPLIEQDVIQLGRLGALARTRPRKTTYFLVRPPQIEQNVIQLTILVAEVKTRPRRTTYRLRPPTVAPAAQALARPIDTTLVSTRPRRTTWLLRKPTVLLTFRGPSAPRVRTRPARTTWELRPPATLEPWSVALRERTIRTPFVRTRPRPTSYKLRPPATLEPFSVELREQTIRVSLVKARPKPTTTLLSPPATLEPYSVELRERLVATTLVHTRPRPTTTFLQPPTVLQVFGGPQTHLVRARPRPTIKWIKPPTVVRVPSVEQREQTIAVSLIRTRPRPTSSSLGAPTVIRVPSVEQREQTITVIRVRIRPRPTTVALQPPSVIIVNPPVVTTVLVKLVRARPQPTVTLVSPPATLEPESVQDLERRIRTAQVRARPRPIRSHLSAPTVVAAAAVAETTLSVTLARVPRRTVHSHLASPTVLQTFAGPVVRLIRTIRRFVHSRLEAPAVVATVTPVLAEPTRVAVAETRRPTIHSRLFPPVAVTVALAEPTRVAITEARRPSVHSRLYPPTVVAAQALALERTIRVVIPLPPDRRQYTHKLSGPTTLRVFRDITFTAEDVGGGWNRGKPGGGWDGEEASGGWGSLKPGGGFQSGGLGGGWTTGTPGGSSGDDTPQDE